jgi:hypothetical protein
MAQLLVVAAAAQTINMPVYVNGVLSSAAGTHIQVVATFHYIGECSSPVSVLEKVRNPRPPIHHQQSTGRP